GPAAGSEGAGEGCTSARGTPASSTRVNVPSPVVTSVTVPSLAVAQRLSLAAASTQLAAVPFLQLVAPSKLWMVRDPGPPIAAVSVATVALLGWQYVRLVPSPILPEEITA